MRSIIPNLRLYLFDKAKRLNALRYFNLYLSSFDWSRDQLLSFQFDKLKILLHHAWKNVPYYREMFDHAQCTPEDIKCIDDLSLLPILTREHIYEEYDKLIDKTNEYKIQFPSSSSGTTGTPIKYIHDVDGESAGIAAGYAMNYLSGCGLGSKKLHIWGNPVSQKNWERLSSRLKRTLFNQMNYPAHLLNDTVNYPSLLRLIRTENPDFIDGYSSSIGSFAGWLIDQNIRLNGIRAVFTTAENLTPGNRISIENSIGPVSDLYGCGEINGIGIQPINAKRYAILEPHVIVETVMNNGINEVVVTDLDNRIMPLIRYKIGDTIDDFSTNQYVADLPFSTFGRVDGRIADYIKLPNGKIIHPVNLLGGTFLRKFPQIKRHKVVWDGKLLRFELECNTPLQMDLLRAEIYGNLSPYAVDFEVLLKDKLLPGKSGKFRYIEIESEGHH